MNEWAGLRLARQQRLATAHEAIGPESTRGQNCSANADAHSSRYCRGHCRQCGHQLEREAQGGEAATERIEKISGAARQSAFIEWIVGRLSHPRIVYRQPPGPATGPVTAAFRKSSIGTYPLQAAIAASIRTILPEKR